MTEKLDQTTEACAGPSCKPLFGAALIARLEEDRDRFQRLWQEEREARIRDMQERDDWLQRTWKAYRSRLAWHITANRANRRGRQAAEARVKELEGLIQH